MTTEQGDAFEAIVVGGGAAGLSAAIALGRARRRVAVIDAGRPRNAPAAGVHNFLTRDGVGPLELTRLGRAEAQSYGVRIIEGRVERARATEGDGLGFAVDLADGTSLAGRRLVLATGVTDVLPDVAGLRERFGRDVLHCPYCHGWEVRDRAIGILGSSPAAVHQSLMWRQWSDDVTLFLHAAPEPSETEAEQLAARGIRVVRGPVGAVTVEDDRLAGVVLADGARHPVEALVTATTLALGAEVRALLDGLGLAATPHPMGVGEQLLADEMGQTVVRGVWAAGNLVDPMAQVVLAAGHGMRVGAALNMDLITEETERAVAAARAATVEG